jgi:hypothetical protein
MLGGALNSLTPETAYRIAARIGVLGAHFNCGENRS